MKFLSQLYDFMFAPAGTFDSDSSADVSFVDTSYDIQPMVINPASGMPMIEGTGIDVLGNTFGTDDSHHHDFATCATDTNDMFNHDCGSSMFNSDCGSSTFDDDWSAGGSGSMFD